MAARTAPATGQKRKKESKIGRPIYLEAKWNNWRVLPLSLISPSLRAGLRGVVVARVCITGERVSERGCPFQGRVAPCSRSRVLARADHSAPPTLVLPLALRQGCLLFLLPAPTNGPLESPRARFCAFFISCVFCFFCCSLTQHPTPLLPSMCPRLCRRLTPAVAPAG